jgi:hypothetical protein
MLYLDPPYYAVDDIVLFPDHLNKEAGNDKPLQFYYAPVTPHLSQNESGWQLRLFKFADDSPTAPKDGGLLNLQVELGISEEQRQKIIKEMAQHLKVPEARVQLSPVMFEAGDVQMFVLDGFSAKQNTPRASDAFVKQIEGTKPALHSNNQALFSVMLSPKGATFVEQALQGEMSAIGVSYTLQFSGLKPAYRVKVKAKWDEVSDSISSSVGASFIVSADIKNLTEKLIRSGLIEIESDTYGTDEEVKGASEEARAFQEQLVDLVTEKFFTPMISPEKPEESGQGGLLSSVSSLIDMVGKSRTLFHYNQEKAHKSLKADLTAEAHRRVTVTRTLVANAFLANIIKPTGVGKEVVSRIDLADDFYKKRSITIKSITPFGTNSIASIDVTLRYGSKTEYCTLSSDTETKTFVWTSLLDGKGAMRREILVDYKVNFKRDELYQQRGAEIVLLSQVCKQDVYEIVAYRDLFDTRKVEFQIDAGFRWTTYPRVDVELKYVDEAHKIKIEKLIRLSASAPKGDATLFVRVAEGKPFVDAFSYRVTFVGNTQDDVPDRVTGWLDQTQGTIVVSDPAPYKRKLSVDADEVDWTATKSITLMLRYNDPANDLAEKGKLVLDKTKKTADFTFYVKDPRQKWIEYDLLIKTSDGLRRIVNCRTRDDDLFIDDPVLGTRPVEIIPDGQLSRDHSEVVAYFLGSDKKEKEFRFSKDQGKQCVLDRAVDENTPDSVKFRVEYLDAKKKLASRYPKASGQYVTAEGGTVRVPLTPPR